MTEELETFRRTPTGAAYLGASRYDDRQLRELRLHHWKTALAYREYSTTTASGTLSARYVQLADQHLKFVQVLNDFFPIGDTAEQDAQKEHPTS